MGHFEGLRVGTLFPVEKPSEWRDITQYWVGALKKKKKNACETPFPLLKCSRSPKWIIAGFCAYNLNFFRDSRKCPRYVDPGTNFRMAPTVPFLRNDHWRTSFWTGAKASPPFFTALILQYSV